MGRQVQMRWTSVGGDPVRLVHRGPGGKPKSMRASVLDSLQDYILHAGVLGIVEGVLGVLAFGGLLSALLGSSAIKAGAIVAVMIAYFGLFVLLAANRVEWRRRTELDQRLLTRYCDALKQRHKHSWRYTSWDHVVTVDRNGDTHERIRISAVAESEFLDFLSFWEGPNGAWSERLRRKTIIKVRSVDVDALGGTRYDVTSSWISRNRLKVTVHLGEPARQGDSISMLAEIYWPKKCASFTDGHGAEEFVRQFGRPIDLIQYKIVLPFGYDVYCDPIGFCLSDPKADQPVVKKSASGQTEVWLTVRDVAPDRRVGVRLDLK